MPRTKAEIDKEYCDLCMMYGDAYYKTKAIKDASDQAVKAEEEKMAQLHDKMLALNIEASLLPKEETKEATDVSAV